MKNLMIGVELLFTGLTVVFLVLIFLMYIMKLMSAIIDKQSSEVRVTKQPPVIAPGDLKEEEFVAAMTVLSRFLPENKQAIVKFKAID